jgi:hypothetical protein
MRIPNGVFWFWGLFFAAIPLLAWHRWRWWRWPESLVTYLSLFWGVCFLAQALWNHVKEVDLNLARSRKGRGLGWLEGAALVLGSLAILAALAVALVYLTH